MSASSLALGLGRLLSPGGPRGRLAVFCFHQVLDAPDANRAGEPTVEEFERDIALIGRAFDVLTFGEAVSRLRSGALPPRAACVTFDDGYENNHGLAAPVLEKLGVPATFFIAGGAVDRGVMWNDLAIEAVAAAGGWPELPAGSEFLEAPGADVGEIEASARLIGQLKYRPMAERWEVSRRLYEQNVGPELPRLMMDRSMVADLAARGFEIGGHTIDHPILRELPDDEARREIEDCREWVSAVTGSPPVSFAYPNGRTGIDYDERHVEMVRKAGFRAAASTDWGVASRASDPLAVPRTGPWWRQGRSFGSGLLRSYLRSYVPSA